MSTLWNFVFQNLTYNIEEEKLQQADIIIKGEKNIHHDCILNIEVQKSSKTTNTYLVIS